MRKRVYRKLLVLQRRIESEHTESAPVAVDILGRSGPSAGLLVVHRTVADAVLRGREAEMCHHSALQLPIISIVEEAHIVRKCRLQSRISDSDVQRIRVVGNRQQVLHARLTAASTIHKTQLAHFRKTVTEINIRGKVEYVSGRINHIIPALIGQYRMLRLERHPRTQLILLTDEAQRHGRIVVVVSVLRIFAQAIHGMRLVSGRQRPVDVPLRIVQHIECGLVALTVLVLELIAELQESGARNRFAVRNLSAIIIVVGRCCDILVAIQHGVAAQRVQYLVIAGFRLPVLVVVVVAVAEASAEGYVTSAVIQLPVELQRGGRRNAFAFGQRSIIRCIDTDIFQRVVFQPVEVEKIVRVGNQAIRVRVECSRFRTGSTVCLAVREVRTENDIRHRIRLPLQTEVGKDIRILVLVDSVRIGV